MTAQICDACRRLRIKCEWSERASFTPSCDRCTTYRLSCLIESATWTSHAVKAYVKQTQAQEPVTRSIFWGPSSNAGGHPLDLHNPRAPLTVPDPTENQATEQKPTPSVPAPASNLTAAVSVTTSTASAAPAPLTPVSGPLPTAAPGGSLRALAPPPTSKNPLNISPRVKDHLYSIFFDYIQPVWPVVTRESLQRYPPTVLLEAAILGVAARHHLAIASWRDFVHIREVIELESRQLFGFRQPYRPTIQTLQALLIMILRVDLFTREHSDFQKYSMRVTFAFTLARDLGLHTVNPADDPQDAALKQCMWLACLHQDTYVEAALGQPLNTTRAQDMEFGAAAMQFDQPIRGLEGHAVHKYFIGAAVLSSCMRQVLRVAYRNDPATGSDVCTDSNIILEQIRVHMWYLESKKLEYDVFTWQSLKAILNNIHLLFVLGLRTVVPNTHPAFNTLQQIVSQETTSIILEACETLEYTTPDLMRSAPGQIVTPCLYVTARASMVVIDILRDSRTNRSYNPAILDRIVHAATCAKMLMEFLLAEKEWGFFWTQGNTLKAVLSRLDPDVFEALGAAGPEQVYPPQQFAEVPEFIPPVEQLWGQDLNVVQLSNTVLNPTSWEQYFVEQGYNQEFVDWTQVPYMNFPRTN
ncbi:hypothetical protein F5884DRAFT_311335 [Xylogone sp. PMI_703]|nr:hypothetical protein F5884DRAFT_311335 [Xylogone sp. PMI_703]